MAGCWQTFFMAMAALVSIFFIGGTTTFSDVSSTGLEPTLVPTPGDCRVTSRGGTVTTPIDDAPVRAAVGSGHVLSGVVRSAPDCAVIAGAKIIIWLANSDGQYDAEHRATVFTDANGHYRFESNFPGEYDGVRPHIHLYVEADGYRAIETEYLPIRGQTEGIFDIALQRSTGG